MGEKKELKGLGGWLILVGIGVVFGPVRLLAEAFPLYTSIFRDGTWEALTTVSSEVYDPLWGPFIIGEIVFNSLVFAASILLVYLFFTKHYLFPKLFIAIFLVTLVSIPIDAWVLTRILPGTPMFDSQTTTEFARTLIAALIWIPYMLVSKRVKATFVEKSPNVQRQPTAEHAVALPEP